MAEHDEVVQSESLWPSQRASEEDANDGSDAAAEPWRIPRSVANPTRLRLGVSRQSDAASISSSA
ncbi:MULTISPECIES: hypothetical protein [Protofrankia]|uniref:Uncharacterized protein n=1 Tax=Candidatus Protofrankia datiscae TaxID=2716812 RepID=F8B6N8_9ACTN|nr:MULTISPECIES: hypothetical protein [Protofrankia]AEH10251.1 hypothetical protein FsymDg_2926 [Candidatus Protofrankia datiscae]